MKNIKKEPSQAIKYDAPGSDLNINEIIHGKKSKIYFPKLLLLSLINYMGMQNKFPLSILSEFVKSSQPTGVIW
ncbi:MAG: hypothetical protein JWQ66_4418 [Mucilaginibacter sp.]|nr:hypothetical protein [Mucilaginibacter sp.]